VRATVVSTVRAMVVIAMGSANATPPKKFGPLGRSRESGVSGMSPPLATASLNGGSPNLMGADRAWKFYGCSVNRARVGGNIATFNQKENEETRKGGEHRIVRS